MPRKDGKHCPHHTGTSSSHGMASTSSVMCCKCGRVYEISYRTESNSVPGHGPHFQRESTIAEPVQWADFGMTEVCPDKTDKRQG
jgi:hypothetical protein